MEVLTNRKYWKTISSNDSNIDVKPGDIVLYSSN